MDHRGNTRGLSNNISNTNNTESRRRSHDEMGKFVKNNSNTDREVDIPHKSASPKIVDDLLTFNNHVLACTGTNEDTSITNTRNVNGPLAKRNFGMCLGHTAAAAGDFAVMAAEVYRQECRSDNRGRDSAFFADRRRLGSRSRSRSRKRREKETDDHSTSIMDGRTSSEEERRDTHNDDDKADHPLRKEPSGTPPKRSPRGTRFPGTMDCSPPAVDRTSASNKAFEPATDNGNLMEARMELFRLGQESVPQAEVRLARALQDLKRQDKVIDGWKRQLEMTQQHLDEIFAELEKTKKESQEKQYRATEVRARAVQERKKLQDMYDQELEQRKKLEDSISKLQREVSSLKISLRNARNANVASSSPDARSRGTASSTEPATQVISLKAEIVELKSQLAEARATNIDDQSTLNSAGDAEYLRKRLEKAESELEELRSKDFDLEALKTKHQEAQKALQEKIDRIETEASETRTRLEENLKEAVEEENQVRSELVKAKANVQRLERERSRKRLHSSADVERLSKQLERAQEEVSKLSEQLALEQKSSTEQIESLKKDLRETQQKLIDSAKDFSENTTASLEIRRSLKADLENLQEEFKDLKQKLEAKTEEATLQAKRISELEATSKERGSGLIDPITSSRQISELKDEVKALRATELTLRAEITRYQAKTAQEKLDAAKEDSLRKAKSADEAADIDKLKNQIEQYQKMEQVRREDEELSSKLRKDIIVLEKKVEFLQRKLKTHEDAESKGKAAEQSLKNEISILKGKLNESEAKCTEERFRAEEERRISKENEARHAEEIDELRQETEKSTADRLKLREELEELRKQLASGIAEAGKMSAKTTEADGAVVPQKVTKLRGDLALARARLAAAREQTTSTFGRSPSLHCRSLEKVEESPAETTREWTSDRSSECSMGSSWAPPGKKKAEASPQPSEPPVAPALEKVKEGESKGDSKTVEKAGSALSPTRGTLSMGQKSLVDVAEQDVFPENTAQTDKYETPVGTTEKSERTRADSSVEELRRQLMESSMRLEKANTRLNGFADVPGMQRMDASPLPPYRGINSQMILTLGDEEQEFGVMDEVVTSDDSGSIEVQRVRYVDI